MHLFWNMITDFTENYKNTIRGRYDGKNTKKVEEELSGGAMVKKMFNELYDEYLSEKFRATNRYSDRDIEQV